MLKTIFWGNSDFVLPSLKTVQEESDLLAIFTGLDHKIGRNNKKVKIPEPKEFGLEKNIDVFQNQDLNDPDLLSTIKELKPDIMIVISYGKIIPKSIFSIPRLGTINVHGSLLPKYRGASPMQQALLHGDKETGVSLQKINEKMDEGDLVLSSSLKIDKKDHYLSLKDKLAQLSASSLKELFAIAEDQNSLKATAQSGNISYCHKIKKSDGEISFEEETAENIYNKWRAFYLWPGIFCKFKDSILKIKEIELVEDLNAKACEIVQADKSDFIVACKKGSIRIKSLQPQNKRAMSYKDFLNGHQIKKGDLLK